MSEKSQERADQAVEAMAEKVIESLRAGLANPADWKPGWAKVDSGFNPVTERRYTGFNWLICAVLAEGEHVATYKHWQSAGAQVRKGEHGTVLLRPITAKVTDEETGEVTYRKIPGRFSTFTVFFEHQVDGYERPAEGTVDPHDVDEAYGYAKVVTGGRVLEGGSSANYSLANDVVHLPGRDQWFDVERAWSTMAHEITHFTGAEKRLNRHGRRNGIFGSPEYAAEELVAEMGAAMLLAHLGMTAEPRQDHLDYLGSWLRALEDDPRHLVTAASAAQAAVNWIVEHAGSREEVLRGAA